MEVRINDNTIDVHLENEKNAYEVIRQLDDWLSKEGFFISSILVNGRASSPSEVAVLEGIKTTEIETLDLTALPLNELSFERFATLLQYFSYFNTALKETDQILIRDLQKELPHILANIDSILGLKVGDLPVSAVLAELFAQIDVQEETVAAPVHLQEFIKHLCLYIEGRIREIANPLLELKSTAGMLDSQIPKMEEIPILLQTGKEREAMEMVVAFTEISEKLNRLLPLLQEKDENNLMGRNIQGMSFGEFYQGLNGKLMELAEALEAEDSILIGDLLEYEIAPLIRQLVDSIEQLPAFSGIQT